MPPTSGFIASGILASLALVFNHLVYPKYFDAAAAAGNKPIIHHFTVNNEERFNWGDLQAISRNASGNEGRFSWDDLEAISRNAKGNCGADKCFWRSTSDPENVGYLVASAGYHYRKMNRAFQFAKEILEGQCNANHLLLDPPVLVQNVSQDFLRQLNSLTDNPAVRIGLDNAKKSRRDIFYLKDSSLAVQKVKVAPSPSLFFGYTQGKWESMVKSIPTFREQAKVPLPIMEERLEAARKSLRCAMDHKETYWWDIQGLVDVEGNYYHIDIDSHFWEEAKQHRTRREEGGEGKGKKQKKKPRNNFKEQNKKIGWFNDMIQRLTHPRQSNAAELRKSSLQEQAEAAAAKGDGDVEQIIKKIIRGEAIRATFDRLRFALLSRAMWLIFQGIWKQRNTILHDSITGSKVKQMDERLQKLYFTPSDYVSDDDLFLFQTYDLNESIELSPYAKEKWLETLYLAVKSRHDSLSCLDAPPPNRIDNYFQPLPGTNTT